MIALYQLDASAHTHAALLATLEPDIFNREQLKVYALMVGLCAGTHLETRFEKPARTRNNFLLYGQALQALKKDPYLMAWYYDVALCLRSYDKGKSFFKILYSIGSDDLTENLFQAFALGSSNIILPEGCTNFTSFISQIPTHYKNPHALLPLNALCRKHEEFGKSLQWDAWLYWKLDLKGDLKKASQKVDKAHRGVLAEVEDLCNGWEPSRKLEYSF